MAVEIKQEIVFRMTKVEKSDCLNIDDAVVELDVSRATLYNYMNVLGIQRIKFPFDRRAYVLKSDLETVRAFLAQNREGRTDD